MTKMLTVYVGFVIPFVVGAYCYTTPASLGFLPWAEFRIYRLVGRRARFMLVTQSIWGVGVDLHQGVHLGHNQEKSIYIIHPMHVTKSPNIARLKNRTQMDSRHPLPDTLSLYHI
ncbi:unnamed protein product [Choristocarpus tenellus]